MSVDIPYFAGITFNKNIFSKGYSIAPSYDLTPNDSNIVSELNNDVKILINTIDIQQTQINNLNTQMTNQNIEMNNKIKILEEIIKNLVNTNLIY